jgi:hypothetical protein
MEQHQHLDGSSKWHLKLADVEQAVSALRPASSDTQFLCLSDESINSNLSVVPNSAQVIEIRARLQSLHNELRIIDAHIAKVHNRSIDLVPIHRLPNEILGSIFIEAVATVSELWPYTISFATRDAISNVCHIWHSVCAGVSALWTSVEVNDSPDFYRTSLSIQRARGLPLSIALWFEGRSDCVKGSMALLSEVIGQIDEIYLEGQATDLMNVASSFNKLGSNTLVLRKLRIVTYSDELVDVMRYRNSMQEFFHSLPRLIELRLVDQVLRWSDLPPVGNIVSLRLSQLAGPTLRELEDFISACPGLRELGISAGGRSVNEVRDGDKGRYICAALHSLYITSRVHHLLSMTSAPFLRKLFIDSDVLCDHIDELVDFIMESPLIDELTVVDQQGWSSYPYTEQKLEVLRALPNLERLCLQGGAISSEVLKALTPLKERGAIIRGPVCPRLRDLELVRVNDCPPSELADMVINRVSGADFGIQPLSLLSIRDCGPSRENMSSPRRYTEEAMWMIEGLLKSVVWDWDFSCFLD